MSLLFMLSLFLIKDHSENERPIIFFILKVIFFCLLKRSSLLITCEIQYNEFIV